MTTGIRNLYVLFCKIVQMFRTSGAKSVMRKVGNALRRGGLEELRRTSYTYLARYRTDELLNQSLNTKVVIQKHNRRSKKQLEGELCLDPDHGVDEAAWLSYTIQLYQKYLFAQPNKLSTPKPNRRLVVIVDDMLKNGAGDSVLTHSALSKLDRSSLIKVEVRWLRDSLFNPSDTNNANLGISIDRSDISNYINPNDLVLFLKSGDEVHPEILPALNLFKAFDCYFSLIDLYVRDASRIFPILLHGVDSIHALYCDYFYSRYMANGDAVLGAISELGSNWSIREVSLVLLRAMSSNNVLKSTHVSLPLIGIRESLIEIRSARNALLHAALKEAQPNIESESEVSVIICTKDNAHLLRQLVRSLLVERHVKEIIIVSNNTTNPCAIELLDRLSVNERVRVLRYDQSFNFSRQCNLGAEYSKGDYLLFINDDIVPVSEDWLNIMVRMVKCNPRRIIGPLLLYPNETVQHGGMYIGHKGLAGHTLRYAKIPDGGYNFMLSAPRNVSCLTGACMLIPRQIFDNLNGFDPMLATHIQDVDLSLRALYSGVELVFDPRAILLHMESISIKPSLTDNKVQLQRSAEFDYFSNRWAERINPDHWVNPLFHPDDESLCRLYTPTFHH